MLGSALASLLLLSVQCTCLWRSYSLPLANALVVHSTSRARTRGITTSRFGSAVGHDHAQDSDSATAILQAALKKVEAIYADPAIGKYLAKLNKLTHVDASTIPGAGRGLFAGKDIKRGTIVALYPVHGLGLEKMDEDDDTLLSLSCCCAFDGQDQAYFDSKNTNGNDDTSQSDHNDSYKMYLIGSRRLVTVNVKERFVGHSLFVDVNPNRPDVSGLRGHLINDGANMEASSGGGGSVEEDNVLEYYGLSRSRRNCVHVPFGPAPLLATVTTRKVAKGEELFTTYGGSFWDSNFGVTRAIQDEAKLVAQDLLMSMKSIQVTCQNDAGMFHKLFDSPN